MSIVQGTLPVGSLDHAITLNVQSSGGSHFETVTNTTPYLHRASPQDVASSMKLKKVVGGTIAWNQKLQNSNAVETYTRHNLTFTRISDVFGFSVSGTFAPTQDRNAYIYKGNPSFIAIVSGHKYLVTNTSKYANTYLYGVSFTGNRLNQNPVGGNVYLANETGNLNFSLHWGNNIQDGTEINETVLINIFDLTQMYGSTIADYIYTLERGRAGDGVAWFKALFGEDYYPYNAGELLSVKTSARKTYNADNVEIGSYALDDNLTLRGIPKLDGNNELYYDGDTYASDGTVTRRYGVIDLGSSTLGWQRGTSGDHYVFDSLVINKATGFNFVCPKYVNARTYRGDLLDKQMGTFNLTSGTYRISIRDDSYSDASSFTTAMSGVYLVYELATPTTESADAYTQSQRVGATEEFVDGRTVEIPVGNESEYKRLIQED